MEDFDSILCFCPSSRLSLASLVLSTWTRVARYVLTEDPSCSVEPYSAVLVMDRFVTRAFVEKLVQTRPVFVLAWNGLFEIDRYRTELDGINVTYIGTDERLEGAPEVPYLPMINSHCAFDRWRDLYRTKRQFRAVGNSRYRGRWLRTRVMPLRPLSVLIAAAGAVARPRALTATLHSGIVSNKLVWAGNCYLDFSDIGLGAAEQELLETGIATIKAMPTQSERLRGTMTLIGTWEAHAATALGSRLAHQRFYVTNTLLRWCVLAFLSGTVKESTWFFGRDNLGIGLEFELYVHNLVSNHRIAFLEFGGKTSATALYPRSLHLLARQFYVIPIPSHDAPDDVIAVTEGLGREMSAHPRELFEELEDRRRTLYQSLPATCELHEVQARVWNDFASRQ